MKSSYRNSCDIFLDFFCDSPNGIKFLLHRNRRADIAKNELDEEYKMERKIQYTRSWVNEGPHFGLAQSHIFYHPIIFLSSLSTSGSSLYTPKTAKLLKRAMS